MPNEPQGQKPPKTEKPPRKLSGDSMPDPVRAATKREVGDMADKIMRAPKKKP